MIKEWLNYRYLFLNIFLIQILTLFLYVSIKSIDSLTPSYLKVVRPLIKDKLGEDFRFIETHIYPWETSTLFIRTARKEEYVVRITKLNKKEKNVHRSGYKIEQIEFIDKSIRLI